SRLAEVTEDKLAIGTGDDARQMQVGIVSASFFGFFDAPPALGRYFTAAEDQPPNGTAVAVLTYPMWQTRFGGARDVLGKPIQIGATTYTIIGVAPSGFAGLWESDPPAAFIPVTAYGHELGTNFAIPGEAWYSTYHWTWASMIAAQAGRQPRGRDRRHDPGVHPELSGGARAVPAHAADRDLAAACAHWLDFERARA